MKKIYCFLFFILISITTFAQQTVKLNINHKLNSQPYLTTLTGTNNLGNTFKNERLQYYISKIAIIHDGAQTTDATGIYALVNASLVTSIDLGSFNNITNIEGISFGIGVNTPENNQDPALLPSSHPLSPKNPSMHWGWAGYFFVAMSGVAGSSAILGYELHALGNSNYQTQTVTVNGSLIAGEQIITLDANYEQALKDINVSSGLVVHGETAECVTICSNFRNHVFTAAAQTTVSTVGIKESAIATTKIVLYPNPNTNGIFHVNDIKSLNPTTLLKIIDVSGRTVLEKPVLGLESSQIELKSKGIYFVSLLNENEILVTQKVIVL